MRYLFQLITYFEYKHLINIFQLMYSYHAPRYFVFAAFGCVTLYGRELGPAGVTCNDQSGRGNSYTVTHTRHNFTTLEPINLSLLAVRYKKRNFGHWKGRLKMILEWENSISCQPSLIRDHILINIILKLGVRI